MADSPPILAPGQPDPVTSVYPTAGGITFRDAAPMICGVVDNGVCADDPRVLVRLNEATKIVLDYMVPVGGMVTAEILASDTFVLLPPVMENVIEAYPIAEGSKVWGSKDITQGWYGITDNSTYLDPDQHHDNPLVDWGMWPDPNNAKVLRRRYQYPGLTPKDSLVRVTGAKRFIPIKSDGEYLIVQNVEALKCIILSIERYENNDIQGAQAYRQSGIEMLTAEVKKHILDPRNYMRRKAEYQKDITTFAADTLGWIRANIAIDVPEAMKTGKIDLTWSINQIERRIMQAGIFKDTIQSIRAEVVDGYAYMPLSVGSILAANLDGAPIPVRSQFFEHLENGPGECAACTSMLVDQGDHYFAGAKSMRRKYKLVAGTQASCLHAVCKLRWIAKQPTDLMVIKNYEAIRLMMTAKFLEEAEKWQEAQVNQQQAFAILNKELQDYLAGIRHTVHIQTYGFGLGDVGSYYTR